jgi:hypothetical protein
LEIPLGNALKNISKSENIPSIPKNGTVGIVDPHITMGLDRIPVKSLPPNKQDSTASTRPLAAPQVPILQDETNLAKQVPILHG